MLLTCCSYCVYCLLHSLASATAATSATNEQHAAQGQLMPLLCVVLAEGLPSTLVAPQLSAAAPGALPISISPAHSVAQGQGIASDFECVGCSYWAA